MTRLSETLRVPKGLTAAVGGGGKTSLLWRLALELSEKGRVVLATTTHIRPPQCLTLLDPTRQAVEDALKKVSLIAIGRPTPDGKLAEVKGLQGQYEGLADYVLIEADGSRGLPLKAPAEYEPALPAHVSLVLAVAGMDCVGRTVGQAAHRPERYAAIAQAGLEDWVTPEMVATVLDHPYGQRKGVSGPMTVVLNQTDTPQRLMFARAVAERLREDVAIVALQNKPEWVEYHACIRTANDVS
ncbi:MAG TPA: selenium cofactor biosynthesis protein YqeC [Candidatus Limiplasma sp.]|nr:selenium cofactor biosynthesis protein YqeC [Candidatus Limiplasma sp.]HPS80500.1 selenium cofactor biosynthesis protein YqeC [Candidatus Limiplasma sp.]